jgi:hypothetical protein
MKHKNMKHKKEFAVFETKTSTWNNGMRNFGGELIKDGFSTIEEAEDFLVDRLDKIYDKNVRCFILPIYQSKN